MLEEENDKKLIIDVDAIDRIIRETALPLPANKALNALLRDYLRVRLTNLVLRAPVKSQVSRKQYEKVARLHEEFKNALEVLQDTSDPPPLLAAKKNILGQARDPWVGWLSRVRFLDEATSERGRNPSGNRDATGELVAIYRKLYDREPSANTSSEKKAPPTLRFIKACMNEVKLASERQHAIINPTYFKAPSAVVLRKWLAKPESISLAIADYQLEVFLQGRARTEE